MQGCLALAVVFSSLGGACHAYDRDQYGQLVDGSVQDALPDASVNDIVADQSTGADVLDVSDVSDVAVSMGVDVTDTTVAVPDAVVVTDATDATDTVTTVDVPDSGCGPELVLNGGFEPGLLAWTSYIDPGTMATISPSTNNPFEGSHSANIDVLAGLGASWHAQINQAPLIFPGSRLRMSFVVRGDPGRMITIGFQHAVSPFTAYCSERIPVTATWTPFSFDCVAPMDNGGEIFFLVGDSLGNTFIDAVSLKACP